MSDTSPELQARAATAALIRDYYGAFNRGETDVMLDFLTDDVIHDVNQGERRQGKEKFRAFNARMTHNYKEELKDIVVLVSKDATRRCRRIQRARNLQEHGRRFAGRRWSEIRSSGRHVLRDPRRQDRPRHHLLQSDGLDRAGRWLRHRRNMTTAAGDKKKLDVKSVTGEDILKVLPDLSRLRMIVFRDWPYLYEGTLEYEQKYLEKFAKAKGAVVIAAYDGDQMVGASTGAPMIEHADEFGEPF